MRAFAGLLFLFCTFGLSSAALTPPATGSPAIGHGHDIPPPDARVDINHATIEELLKVPGMTATWAARTVRFRPYRTKQDLVERGVMPTDVYDRVKDYVIAHRDKQ